MSKLGRREVKQLAQGRTVVNKKVRIRTQEGLPDFAIFLPVYGEVNTTWLRWSLQAEELNPVGENM